MSLEIIQQKINNGEGYIEIENQGIVKVSNMNPDNNVIRVFNKHDYKLVNNELILKTESDYENENKNKVRLKILNQIKPLIDSMSTQQLGLDKGLNPADVLYTDDEIKNWIGYSNKIAKGQINAIPPEIPVGYKNII